MFDLNPIIGTDSYKVTHWPQYPAGTQAVEAYLEARGLSDFAKTWATEETIISYGALSYLLHNILGEPVTHDDIEEAREFFADHFGNDKLFNIKGWQRVVNNYGGWLPLHVRAVPEGLHVPIGNILMGVASTDQQLGWLTNYMETRLSHAWYPYTVATLSWNCRQTILKHLRKSGTPESIDFKLHDFGFRGVETDESSAVGGSAHLVNFKGTDTMSALMLLRKFYGAKMAGFSIPAAEHSTITTWGRSREVDAYDNMLTQYPDNLVAVVSDSYNIYDACEKLWGETLRNKVLGRQGVLVIRPDSGDPHKTLPKIHDILKARFGGTVNRQGYFVLDPHVRIIQGDGVNPVSIDTIYNSIENVGYSSDNLGFGSGGALLQKVDRDTFKFAFKACAIQINNEWHDVSKSPVDAPDKKSKAGRMSLYLDERIGSPTRGTYVTHRRDVPATELPGPDMMRTMYQVNDKMSFIGNFDTLDVIRERAAAPSLVPHDPMSHEDMEGDVRYHRGYGHAV